MSYQVKLEVFEGPFDLLLQLIARREIDATEVDLADITADYLASLPDIEQLDLETATQFLVVASALIQIKAARLLPSDDDSELDDLISQTRDVLYARLLEYRAFRDAGQWLGGRAERARGFVPREQPLEPRFQDLVPDADLDVDPAQLARLAASAIASRPPDNIEPSFVRRAYLSVQQAAERILSDLPRGGATTTFGALADGLDRGDRVVFFLSLLELYKLGELDLSQEDWEQDVAVRRRDSGDGSPDLGHLDDEDGDAAVAVGADATADVAQGSG